MTQVLVWNFEKNPKKEPESRFMGVALKIQFHPLEVDSGTNKLSLTIFRLNTQKGTTTVVILPGPFLLQLGQK